MALDVQALSLFRIVFAVFLAAQFFIETYPWYTDLYGSTGILPPATLATHAGYPALRTALPALAIFDALRISNLLPVLYGLALIAFAAGFRTLLANIILFVLNTYLYWANTFVRSGADDLAHLLLLWSLFLPMSRHWSVDSALDPQPPDRSYPALPFIAIRVQIASLYLFSALIKLAGAPWRSGDAIVWALSDTAFGATPAGLFLVHNFSELLHVVNYLVIAFQLAFPFLVYCPWRNNWTRCFALLGAAAMHISFIFCLDIGGFPFLSLTILLLLVPDAWIDRVLLGRRARLGRIAIYYDPDCEFCRRVSLILREFLLPRSATVAPASDDPKAFQLLQQHQSWVVRAADGVMLLKWRALAYLLRRSLLFAPLGWLLDLAFLRRPTDRLYDLIGANRKKLGPFARWLFPDRQRGAIGVAGLSLCAGLSVAALASNISSVAGLVGGESLYAPYRFAEVLQVGQNWTLFAPVPTHQVWTFTIRVQESDGSVVDFMKLLPTPLFVTSPEKAASTSNRWTKYFTRFAYFTTADWAAFGQYLCKKAQRSVEVPVRVVAIDVKASTRSVAAASATTGGLITNSTSSAGATQHDDCGVLHALPDLDSSGLCDCRIVDLASVPGRRSVAGRGSDSAHRFRRACRGDPRRRDVGRRQADRDGLP